MDLQTLTISIAVAALLITLVDGFALKRVQNWGISFLQNFCGTLFVFSGWVKAIDPLGTAYKMEQYFAEFETVFADTAFSFMSGWFPVLAENAPIFSVSVIVLEIVLGVMLLIGSWPRFTSWAFFILVAFFTFLTGFTHLTAYVPEDVNFFDFGNWGPYVKTNMKVTDCGCFGDFLKLEPKVSFYKDLALLVPSILFLFTWGKMHRLFNTETRSVIVWSSIIGLIIYCLSNFVWNLPHTDFRPFKNQANIRLEQAVEEIAETSVQVTAYQLTNKESGEVVELPLNDYLSRYKEFPKEAWDAEQIKTAPVIQMVKQGDTYDLVELEDDPELESELVNYLSTKWALEGDAITTPVEHTKVSEFDISDVSGNSVTYELLNNPDYSFLIVAYKLYADVEEQIVNQSDTIFVVDTVRTADTTFLAQRFDRVERKQIVKKVNNWKPKYLDIWKGDVNPVMFKAQENGLKVTAVTSFNDAETLEDFKKAAGINYPLHIADDILLKTIIRSNPGVLLLKKGEVIMKWHHRHLPDFETIQEEYMGDGVLGMKE